MKNINEYILAYRDSFRDYLHSYFSLVWAIYIFFLVVVALVSYYLIYFKKSDRQKRLTFRSIILLNIAVVIVAAYEISAPSRTSMWILVQDALVSVLVLDLILYASEKLENKHLVLRIVLYVFCFLALTVFVADFVLVEIIPIIKPMGSGLRAMAHAMISLE